VVDTYNSVAVTVIWHNLENTVYDTYPWLHHVYNYNVSIQTSELFGWLASTRLNGWSYLWMD